VYYGTLQLSEEDVMTQKHTQPIRYSGFLLLASSLLLGRLAADDPSRENETIFRLEGAVAAPGADARVPFFIRSNREVRAFCTVINFDETVLEVAEIEPVYVVSEEFNQVSIYPQYEGVNNWGFYFAAFDNSDNEAGDGTNEGVIKASGVFSFIDYVALPVDFDNEMLAFHFHVQEDAQVGETEVRFEDYLEMPDTDPNAVNAVTVDDVEVEFPAYNSVPILINSVLDIVIEQNLFVRGDANSDTTVDMSDAVATLGYLFFGEVDLPCFDAADANDDGEVDIGDPISILSFLFRGGSAPSSPYPDCGADPTIDDLPCESFTACDV
jgi:hypothetical protein